MNDYIDNLKTISEHLDLNDSLCSNPLCLCDEDCGNECEASTLKSNIGTWGWHVIPSTSIYTDSNNIEKRKEGESVDEMIERIVHEVVNQLNEKGDLVDVPQIEKYHMRHK